MGGTNGKGSTVAAIGAALSSAGIAWVSYTSPHLISANERISFSGKPGSTRLILAALEKVEEHRRITDQKLTYFEYFTLAALQCMTDCQVGILEVGLGGARDATNIADADISVITTIALDHQKWLGDTVSEIAADKIGIARKGRPLVLADPQHPAKLEECARQIGVLVCRPQVSIDPHKPVVPVTACGSVSRTDWQCDFAGAHLHHYSLAAALQTLLLLSEKPGLPHLCENRQALLQTLRSTRLEGRLQAVKAGANTWFVDVAHNLNAAVWLLRQLETRGLKQLRIIYATYGDKPRRQIMALLQSSSLDIVEWIMAPTPTHYLRGVEAHTLKDTAAQLGIDNVHTCTTQKQAITHAMRQNSDNIPVLVFGSFTIAGTALKQLGAMQSHAC